MRSGDTVRGMVTLSRSPLHARHVAHGAKLADFGGWEMPIEYAGAGVVTEHTAVRTGVGVFDVSHLGKARVRGAGAAAFVNDCLSNDLGRIAPGKAQYTLCCDDETGGVVDDLIAYLHGDDEVFLVPNAANNAEVVRRLDAAAPVGISVENLHYNYGVLAVQGPSSAALLSELGLPSDHDYMSFTVSSWSSWPVVVCRTGYTGEHGYELVVGTDHVGALWDALLGTSRSPQPCGLGARDTLRTEMGYPLHGHELSLDITPVQARSGWAVGWKKPQFWGRDVLRQERSDGARRTLRGLLTLDRGIPRAGMTVLSDDAVIGEVTSGTFSPSLKQGIGLALISTDAGVSEGDEVAVDVRGRRLGVRVVKPPFVESHVR